MIAQINLKKAHSRSISIVNNIISTQIDKNGFDSTEVRKYISQTPLHPNNECITKILLSSIHNITPDNSNNELSRTLIYLPLTRSN